MIRQINEYLEYIQLNRNVSVNTLLSYGRDIKKMAGYMEELGLTRCDQVQYSHLLDYLEHLKGRGASCSTLSRQIASFRGFFRYLELKGVIQVNPSSSIKSIKSENKLPVVLSIKEVEVFLQQPEDTKIGIRDRAMLEVMYATGIKASELVNLTLGDLNIPLGFIQCSDGKKQRIIPIGKVCQNAMNTYIKEARLLLIKDEGKANRSAGPLFVNSRGGSLSRQGFWKIVKGYAKAMEIDKEITPHMLRHSFACHMLQNGADLKSLQEMMGHESIVSTQVYTKVGDHKLMEVYRKAHPRA